ncbi:MAG: GNAT family N-acetyltransferase [Anaerolineae bacterium]|nr:GNAT family N-acetyltransferase [Anaerolineae bacterium]NIN97288.1 GNAT family N-acetyltransferase [Anaerolineae bacterium]NIQ80218.1 GNAT family N-acetyltransferase [Anaerolineae bacterium]
MIVGEQTRLRAIEREDIPIFVRWLNDPEVRQYLEMYLPMSVAEEEQWFEAQLKDDTSRIFGIETEEGRLIGNIGLHNLDWKNRNALLGIVIAEREYWGRGYGTDAVTTLLDFAFNEMNLHRVSLSVYEFNERAVRCHEKCGFRHEGRAREALFRDGSYHDHFLMAILREEFISEDQSKA